ncbi:phosphoribosylanthranilate isomerase [Haloferax mediterranei ATCC 33500]|uniref:N-(5'-phosphoribosyl)anthranilate isomerase n=1 Tax=Haloferax mediterranei (strain ATCC 33500 / DSM 1411 / JCM 8866 / NBRC 14739 / NCIMB 2177 / R-4) TaxID=523841 RepID=I3R7D9_HALMT|nr:phosphoribosylanthranilate isomerase [Haloferax mediterranei]AFK20149.1 N-(5'-phosphoribosyl)anthranilate isomerase [Haloferax mediterranei ATCC 33500]ELZ99697.1 phosphoribosylanthranilate isomerase [Haloferax mediterranei ATCC 33500]MDX5987099.1 phosphoribosylanthranilate isomerase [Haloferax mediterranei ATCC 33500]QCQ76413.1 phosphoribosylanthranilate isomerase [Haloferax mediterranei ATCC 33500]
MVRVKVCGVTRESDLEAVAATGADAVGAICDVPVDTPREVDAARARELFAAAPPFLSTVLVTMPESVEHARELVREVQPDVLQLHTDLPADELAALRDEGVRIVPVVEATAVERARALAPAVDAILVDTPSASGAGGTGQTHDWDASRSLADAVDVPVILAGGLTPENVADAVRTVAPYGVDVASGVEADGGVKDHGAVRTFVTEAKAAREEYEEVLA